MNQDKLKQMYANGGLLKALLKDPAQRKMAAQMLGGNQYGQGGMMKYANGGPVGPGGPPGNKIPGPKEYVNTNMPYYVSSIAATPEYAGAENREKFKTFVMDQGLPQMMENERGAAGDYTPYRQMRAAMDSYQPAEGTPWSVVGLREHIVNTLGPDHYLTRQHGQGVSRENKIAEMFNALPEYLQSEGVEERALYQVDPATGQRTRVTQEMYEQMGSPTEFSVGEGDYRNRYYVPSAASELLQGAYGRAYPNRRTTGLSGIVYR